MDELLYYKDNCQFLEYTNNSSDRLINAFLYCLVQDNTYLSFRKFKFPIMIRRINIFSIGTYSYICNIAKFLFKRLQKSYDTMVPLHAVIQFSNKSINMRY